MQPPPRVCVLILSYNGKHLLDDCLPSVLGNSYGNFEVVVIDNGSWDGTEAFVREIHPGVTLLRIEKNRGYSGGFNFGLEYGFGQQKAGYCLIMNNDTVMDPGAISALVAAAEGSPRAGFTTGKVYYHEKPDTFQSVGKAEDPVLWNGEHIGRWERDEGQYDTASERAFVDDVFTLVRREMWEETGGYDTTFFLQCEEYDWQARAKKLGWSCLYTPDAKLWHKESMTIGKISPRKAYYDARNPMIVQMRHRPPERFRKFFWHHTRTHVKAVLINGAKFKFSMVWKMVAGYLSGLRWGLANRKLSPRHFF